MANFFVGQKVVCVNARFADEVRIRGVVFPEQNVVYTVGRVFNHVWFGQMLYLNEIRNPVSFKDEATGAALEPPWPANRFRPVVERKTDISIFTAMLNPDFNEMWDMYERDGARV